MEEKREPDGAPRSASSATRADVARETAIVGGGCFWCIEAVFEGMAGVLDVTSGYAGGHVDSPSYLDVCTGRTGHAEVVRLTYDPGRIDFAQILDLFFRAHDPTQKDRQGADVGSQYRSVIFTTSPQQEQIARDAIIKLDASGRHGPQVVTEVLPAGTFYPAEDSHQHYFRKNPDAGYCRIVIQPKLRTLGMT
ncbi:MAG: peptide-methionine (S)-S-oxide reductase MsrA [Pseudomonadota bacterium]